MLITATEFKARCLQILDEVHAGGGAVQITKRGKIVAELVAPNPYSNTAGKPGLGKDKFKIVGDIVSPLDEVWESGV